MVHLHVLPGLSHCHLSRGFLIHSRQYLLVMIDDKSDWVDRVRSVLLMDGMVHGVVSVAHVAERR